MREGNIKHSASHNEVARQDRMNSERADLPEIRGGHGVIGIPNIHNKLQEVHNPNLDHRTIKYKR